MSDINTTFAIVAGRPIATISAGRRRHVLTCDKATGVITMSAPWNDKPITLKGYATTLAELIEFVTSLTNDQ